MLMDNLWDKGLLDWMWEIELVGGWLCCGWLDVGVCVVGSSVGCEEGVDDGCTVGDVDGEQVSSAIHAQLHSPSVKYLAPMQSVPHVQYSKFSFV